MLHQEFSMNILSIDMIVPIVHVSNNCTDIVPELSQGIDGLLPGLGLGVTPVLRLILLILILRHGGHRLICGKGELNVGIVVVEDERNIEVSGELDFLSGNTRTCGSVGDHEGRVESFTTSITVTHGLKSRMNVLKYYEQVRTLCCLVWKLSIMLSFLPGSRSFPAVAICRLEGLYNGNFKRGSWV